MQLFLSGLGYTQLKYMDQVVGEISERESLMDRITVIQGTLSKGLWSMGGYIASSKILIDVIRSSTQDLFYTIAISLVLAASAKARGWYLKSSNVEREKQNNQLKK